MHSKNIRRGSKTNSCFPPKMPRPRCSTSPIKSRSNSNLIRRIRIGRRKPLPNSNPTNTPSFAHRYREIKPMRSLKIFSGSSHRELAASISTALGRDLARSTTTTFSNENVVVRIEEDVRGCDTCVIQTAASPLHRHMMELFMLCDTLRAYGARSICAVIPYFPYIRSDKQDKPGIAITARLVANLLETSGATTNLLIY